MSPKRSLFIPGLAAVTLLALIDRPAPGQAFDLPPGGWAYLFNGDADAGADDAALDGTWNHDNGSDSWDGSGPGTGVAGGAGVFTEGDDTFLRIQDTGDPRQYGAEDPSNRKVYLTHDIGADGAGDTFLNDGVTLSFRARVPTTGALDDRNPGDGSGTVPWPAEGSGLILQNDGKSAISLQQRVDGLQSSIAFALGLPSDTDEAGETGGLLMNHLNGDAPNNDVDTGEGGDPNLLALADPTEWNEFWIAIKSGGAGTHQATIWMNGDDTVSQVFDLTAAMGNEGPFDNVLAMGNSPTGGEGAVDVDFIAFTPGWLPPNLIPGDVNGDKLVDRADLDIIRGNFLAFESGAALADGDVNFDGVVEFQDYRIWSDNRTDGGAAAVPEPTCAGLALIGALAWYGGRRRLGSDPQFP